LYNIITEFGIQMQLLRTMELYLNGTYNTVWVRKYLSDMFPVKNRLQQGHSLSSLLFNISLGYSLRRFKVNQDGLELKGTSWCWFVLIMLI